MNHLGPTTEGKVGISNGDNMPVNVSSSSTKRKPTRTRTDPAWDHCEPLTDPSGKRIGLKCKYCGKIQKGGGIHRLKEHLAGQGKGDATSCQEVPDYIRVEMQNFLTKTAQEPEVKRKCASKEKNQSKRNKIASTARNTEISLSRQWSHGAGETTGGGSPSTSTSMPCDFTDFSASPTAGPTIEGVGEMGSASRPPQGHPGWHVLDARERNCLLEIAQDEREPLGVPCSTPVVCSIWYDDVRRQRTKIGEMYFQLSKKMVTETNANTTLREENAQVMTTNKQLMEQLRQQKTLNAQLQDQLKNIQRSRENMDVSLPLGMPTQILSGPIIAQNTSSAHPMVISSQLLSNNPYGTVASFGYQGMGPADVRNMMQQRQPAGVENVPNVMAQSQPGNPITREPHNFVYLDVMAQSQPGNPNTGDFHDFL